MLSSIYRHLFLPAFDSGLKRRKTFHYLKELERSQWLSRDELDRLQFEALRRLVTHAFHACPYYGEAWSRQGLHPEQLDSLEAFQSWPVTDRETILVNRLGMRARVPGMRLLAKSTGGSSGMPLVFDYDTGSYDRRHAAWHRGYNWAGASLGVKQLYLWGAPLGHRPWWKRFKDDLYNRLHRRLILNTFHMNEEDITDYFKRLNSYRPEVIVAYTNPLYTFARTLDERGWKPFSPKSIVVGAEKLYGFQRALIEKVFGAPVFETYGAREFMLIGSECERREGLHLTHENLLVEVLDDDGRPTPAGEEGNVVITDLYNYGMPFVRYANGDRAVAGWGTCPCGRGLPLLRKVVGRRLDSLHTPDGRHISGECFIYLFMTMTTVSRFQVIQEEPARVQLRVVLKDTWTEGDRKLVERKVRDVLGPAMHFEFIPVNDIPLTHAGKLQVVINRCATSSVAACGHLKEA